MTKNKNKKILFLVFVAATVFWFACSKVSEIKLMKKGEEIAHKADIFKEQNGRFPENLKEIGLIDSENGPLFYGTIYDGREYVISYSCSSLGESASFYSDTKRWTHC